MRLNSKNALFIVLIVALVLRLGAVIFSKGYMANDDHFETVRIASEGMQHGLLDENDHLIWRSDKPHQIGRSPLYVLSLYAVMKALTWTGIERPDPMMYFIRFIHALFSLVTVWLGFWYIRKTTGSIRWAAIGGLILAAFYLMPYISVRNLVEVVSSNFLIPCLYLAWLGVEKKDSRFLVLSGMLGGLAWMIRFNTGLAVVPIPLAIWYLTHRFRAAGYFCLGAAIILIFSGTLDYIYLGGFGRSTINIFKSFWYVVDSPPLPHPVWLYALVILGVFIPPFSLFFIGSIFNRSVIGKHLIIFSSAALFFVAHSLIAHKEERFMLPILPILIILGVIGLHHWLSGPVRYRFLRKAFKYSAIPAVVLNIIILPLFTFNYAHKGMVEPFVYLSKQDDITGIVIDRLERRRFLPVDYANLDEPVYTKLDRWDQLAKLPEEEPISDGANYFVIFSDDIHEVHVDSLETVFGPLERVFHSPPSLMDRILHFLNPRYNHLNESWVYKSIGSTD